MKKKSVSLFLLGLAMTVGFSIPNVTASTSLPEVVTCHFAQVAGDGGYYRCGSGQSCEWIDDRDAYMSHVNRDCILEPGGEVVGGVN